MTGTARHGLVRIWDMRASTSLYARHAAAARRGQSSPVYSLAVDAANMYVMMMIVMMMMIIEIMIMMMILGTWPWT